MHRLIYLHRTGDLIVLVLLLATSYTSVKEQSVHEVSDVSSSSFDCL